MITIPVFSLTEHKVLRVSYCESAVSIVGCQVFSSPEHKVLRVSYCESAVSIVRRQVFSSPEHKVLRVSYCDIAVSGIHRASSVINFLPCVRSRGHVFSPVIMKLGQNVYLHEISYEFENGSCPVKNYVTRSKLKILFRKAQVSESRAIMALLFNSIEERSFQKLCGKRRKC